MILKLKSINQGFILLKVSNCLKLKAFINFLNLTKTFH